MEEQFVTYEVALKLKKLGFNVKCLASYVLSNKSLTLYDTYVNWNIEHSLYCSSPPWQRVIDWFREKHNLHISVLPFKLNDKYDDVKLCWYYVVIDINRDGNITLNADSLNPSIENFNSYEEAREQAILNAIELCKNN